MRTEEILHNSRIYEDERDAVSEQWYIREYTLFEKLIKYIRNLFNNLINKK